MAYRGSTYGDRFSTYSGASHDSEAYTVYSDAESSWSNWTSEGHVTRKRDKRDNAAIRFFTHIHQGPFGATEPSRKSKHHSSSSSNKHGKRHSSSTSSSSGSSTSSGSTRSRSRDRGPARRDRSFSPDPTVRRGTYFQPPAVGGGGGGMRGPAPVIPPPPRHIPIVRNGMGGAGGGVGGFRPPPPPQADPGFGNGQGFIQINQGNAGGARPFPPRGGGGGGGGMPGVTRVPGPWPPGPGGGRAPAPAVHDDVSDESEDDEEYH